MNKNNKERRRVARVVQANNNLWVDAVESQIKRPRRGWDGGRRNKDTKHQKKKGSSKTNVLSLVEYEWIRKIDESTGWCLGLVQRPVRVRACECSKRQ